MSDCPDVTFSRVFLHPQPVFKVPLAFTSVLDETECSVWDCRGKEVETLLESTISLR